MRYLRFLPLLFTPLLVLGCGWEVPPVFPNPTNPTFNTQDVTLAAGMREIQPAGTDTLSGAVNLNRLGVSSLDRVYELETPANTDFSFTVVARGGGNVGTTRLSLGHAADNYVAPSNGIESLAGAGMSVEGAGMGNNGIWLDVTGDGFARVTIHGQIATDQAMVIQVPRPNGVENIGIRVRIGNPSAINISNGGTSGLRPGMNNTTIYSSDSYQFGLPAIAVSGDRYSVVAYDGNSAQPYDPNRRRQWLQYDSQAGSVTGGNEACVSQDAGFWRDQEVSALGNVLAVAYTGNGQVRTDISLDRGATFPIQQVINAGSCWGQRLVQTAIGTDYKLGCLFWRTVGSSSNPSSQLVLVEATPSGFDATNTPTGYNWGNPQVIHAPGTDVTPLLMHLDYSAGGDLAIGYGYTQITRTGGWTVTSSSKFRVCVRQFGQTTVTDKEIDREDNTLPADPHIAILGQGANMELFYSYEKTDGIHMYYSSDAGQTWASAAYIPVPGANTPSASVRMQNGQKRVDLIYCCPAAFGWELHNVHWDNFVLGGPSPALYQVTQANAVPGSAPPFPGMPAGWTITGTAWFGYDAVVKGDDVAVIVHENTFDSYDYYYAQGGAGGMPIGGAGASSGGGGYQGAPPPILLPGMTGTVPAPNSAHRNQLKIAVLD